MRDRVSELQWKSVMEDALSSPLASKHMHTHMHACPHMSTHACNRQPKLTPHGHNCVPHTFFTFYFYAFSLPSML